jgi:PmbA protein
VIPLQALIQATQNQLHQVQSPELLECYFRVTDEWRYEQTQGQLENVERKNNFGAAVRCFKNGRMGFAYCRDARWEAVNAAIAEARALTNFIPADPARTLAVQASRGTIKLADGEFSAAPVLEDVKDNLARLEQAAFASDARVRKTYQAGYVKKNVRHILLNSLGLQGAWEQSESALGIAALAEAAGDSQLGEAYRMGKTSAELSPEVVGREAGYKAAKLLGAAAVPTRRRAVIFPPAVVTGFLEAVFPAWTAEAWQRQRSFLAGRAGERLAATNVSLADDGVWPQGIYTAPWDEEGCPTQRTELLKSGIVQGCLHNQETAARAQTQSTGNGQRMNFSAPPSVGPTNFRMLPGSESPESLLRAYPGALYAADVLGLHTLDPVTGDFSLGASGWLLAVEGREVPVRGITISGNVLAWLNQIERVGNDETAYGHFSAPTVVVRDLLVAGS